MSLLAVQGGLTGSGTVTLLAPITNTNRTLTLPDATGTVALQGGAGVGKVLQVVNATTSTATSNSTNTYADTTLTASITPTSATSKILVLVSQNGLVKTAANADTGIRIRLMRDASQINLLLDRGMYTNSTVLQSGSASTSFLDSPSTTSAITYKTQFACWNSSVAAVLVQDASSTSTITLMEIAA